MLRFVLALSLIVVVSLTLGCGVRRRSGSGGGCELTSECDAPLVCRLAHCRSECATSADCTVGLSCVLDASGLGACQLPDERDCALDSECAAPLVCRLRQCVNACVMDRDCLGGARCVIAPEGGSCVEPVTSACSLDSECATGTFCLDGRCRPQCFTDRDCRNEWRCDRATQICIPPSAPSDGGSTDVGGLDAGDLDAGDLDAGDLDAGGLDGGFDAGDSGAVEPDAPSPTPCSRPLVGAVTLVTSSATACAIVNDTGAARVFCWGSPGSAIGTLVPQRMCAEELTSLSSLPVVNIAIGSNSSCIVAGDTTVSCYGRNRFGVLGRGSTVDMIDVMPLQLSGLFVSELSMGDAHACGRTVAGDVSCWGYNAFAQVDSPATASFPSPIVSMAGAGVRGLSLGFNHSCGLDVAGVPVCWGSDSAGQLGLGGGALAGARAVSAGFDHTCALGADGSVWCWGGNSRGELGDSSTTSRPNRVAISSAMLPVARAIDAEGRNTCALVGPDVYCWGDGLLFGLPSATPVSRPMLVPFGGPVDEIGTGNGFVCARLGGRILCRGTNLSWQLGDGTILSRTAAAPVLF